MNKKIVVLNLVVIFMLACSYLAYIANAQEPENITAWTDKPKYNPGEKGTLYIAFYNNKYGALTIEKIVVIFDSWRAYKEGVWEGNQTITVNKAVASGETNIVEVSFSVPADGRATTTTVNIKVYTSEEGIISPPSNRKFYVYVSESPNYMEQIVSLFTIQLVLLIVCTVIIAATVFISARRPAIMWGKEEKKAE